MIKSNKPSPFPGTSSKNNNLFKLEKAVETSGEMVFMTDREGIIEYINPAFTKVYGFQPSEIVNKCTPRILKSGLKSNKDYEIFWSRLLSGEIVSGEFTNKCKNGNLVIIEGSANPILDDQDKIMGFLAIQRDISVRKQIDQDLEKALIFQQLIIDGIADPIMIISADYRVKLINQAAREFAPNELLQKNDLFCFQITHLQDEPCDGTEHPCPLMDVQETGQTIVVEHEHVWANGEKRFVEVSASPLWHTDGSFEGIIEVVRDISKHIRTKEKLKENTARFRALAAQITEVSELERHKLAQELHDQVGQNLTALGININIIKSNLHPKIDEFIHFHLDDSIFLIEQTTQRIRDVMADLRPPVLDDYGLFAALRWYGDQYSRRTDIAVKFVGDKSIPRLPNRVENSLFRISQEAMTNVAKHASATQLKITIRQKPETLSLIISDNGVGFDPLKPVSLKKGAGWGLLTITERAESVGGNCFIVSAPGQGTKVIVDVPL